MKEQSERHVPSWGRRLFDFVERRFLSLVAVIMMLAGLAGLLGWWPEMGRRTHLALLSGLFVAPYGYIFATYLSRYFLEDDWIWVIDADARETDGALYRFPPVAFRELTVDSGDLEQWSPTLYCGTNVDLDERYCVGRELIAHLSVVYLIRDELEERARKWDRLRPILPWAIRSEASAETARVMEQLEDHILPSGAADDPVSDRIISRFEEDVEEPDGEDNEPPADLAELREALTDDLDPEGETDPEVKAAREVHGDD